MAKASLEGIVVNDPVNFQASGTAEFLLPTFKLSISVLNEPVWMQLLEVPPGMRASSGLWREPQEFIPPSIGSINRGFLIGGVRFRAVTSAPPLPAVVSARPG